MDSVSLPMVPDLDVLPRPIRYLVLGALVLLPLCLAGAVIGGLAASGTVTLDAEAVDATPADATVYESSALPEDGPTRAVAVKATEEGAAAVDVQRRNIRFEPGQSGPVYVRHDGQVVRVVRRS